MHRVSKCGLITDAKTSKPSPEVRLKASTLASTEAVCHSCLKTVSSRQTLICYPTQLGRSKGVRFTSHKWISIPAIARVRLFDLRLPLASGGAALLRGHGFGFHAD